MADKRTLVVSDDDNLFLCPDTYKQVDMCSWQFIIKTIILSLIVVSILIGNSLVIIAVSLYRKLRKSISNSFIVSLAVADLLLAILVLPFSVLEEIFGYWLFQREVCQIWLMIDISVCTSSILHLCAISFDRYIAIAHPLRYPHLMTHKRSRIICLSMWILSFLICFPALIRWDDDPESTEHLSTTNLTNIMYNGNSTNNKNTTPAPGSCVVSSNSRGYTIYSALGSFFIPCFVMTGFYIKIFLLARKFMKQSHSGTIASRKNGQHQMRIHRGPSTTKRSLYKNATSLYEMSELLTANSSSPSKRSTSENCQQEMDFLKDINDNNSAEMTESTSSDTLSFPRKYSTKSNINLLNSLKRTRNTISNTMNRETRAAKTVAIIIGAFILCWCPFFICYLIEGVSNFEINKVAFDVFFWIGYLNSFLNPCIYACFSNDFRHAFKKIAKCQLRRDANRKPGMIKFISSFYISSSSNGRQSITVRPQYLTQQNVTDD